MQKISLILFSLLLFAGLASAQIPTSGNVFFGYSYENTSPSAVSFSDASRGSLNGWEASLEGKIIPWVGFVADIDSHYGSQNFPCSGCGTLSTDINERNFLFGPRVSISVGKFRPFAQALFGAAHISAQATVGPDTSFATAIGGGLDYKIIRPLAWRFQGDYLQTRFFSTTQNNIRLSTGIVLRF
jgi:hypothetical protein